MVVKLIDKESGIVLKDNPDGGKNSGATWAYEVAGKTMVCPIIIEDLSPPGQMLIEVKNQTFISVICFLLLNAQFEDIHWSIKIYRCSARNGGCFWR